MTIATSLESLTHIKGDEVITVTATTGEDICYTLNGSEPDVKLLKNNREQVKENSILQGYMIRKIKSWLRLLIY